jgi:hypothetical protein
MPTRARALIALSCFLSASISTAARAQDETVRALVAAPAYRAGRSGSSPIALHPSGDLVLLAGGVLRIGPSGETRWQVPDADVVDVAAATDGSVYGLALVQPGHRRPGRVRVVRHRDDGSIAWTRTLRGRHDIYSHPQIEGAPDGGAWVCGARTKGSRREPFLERLSATGALLWSITLAPDGQCHALDSDAQGHAVWAGARAIGPLTWAGVVERIDPSGRVVWSQTFDGHPTLGEVAIAEGGSVTVAGDFDGEIDLLPGPREQRARSGGYSSFVTHFDPTGASAWAWWSERYERPHAVLHRGTDTIVIGDGYMARLDDAGRAVQREVFGYMMHGTAQSMPWVSVAGAILDARGDIVIAATLPGEIRAPIDHERYGHPEYHLWSAAPYRGPLGGILGRPGW